MKLKVTENNFEIFHFTIASLIYFNLPGGLYWFTDFSLLTNVFIILGIVITHLIIMFYQQWNFSKK